MTFKYSARALSALLALASSTVAADAAAPQLMVQTTTIALDPLTDQTRGEIHWSHGAFLFEALGAGLPPTFYTLNREGRVVSEVTASMPDVGHVVPMGFDRWDDSSIVFIGQADSAYGEAAPFIGLISADGRSERVIRTAPYYPYMVSVAPDGTFWTLGFEGMNFDPRAPGVRPDAEIMRHFDRAGKLLGLALPQSQFLNSYTAEDRLSSGFIAATRNRIGWYGPGWGKGGEYAEIDLNSMAVHTYPGLPEIAESTILVCFSLTESGNAFLSLYDNASERSTTFMFDRAALKWLTLNINERPAPYLIGVDGEQLVFRDWSSKAIFFSLSH